MIAGETKFLGKPSLSGDPIIIDLDIEEERFDEFNDFNASFWMDVVRFDNNMKQQTVLSIMTDIVEMTSRFQPQKMEEISRQLLQATEENIALAELAVVEAQRIAIKVRDETWYEPLLGLLYSTGGFIGIFIVLYCILSGCVMHISRKSKMMERKFYKRAKRTGPEPEDTSNLISDQDEEDEDSDDNKDETIKVGQEKERNCDSIVAKAWHIIKELEDVTGTQDIEMKVFKDMNGLRTDTMEQRIRANA